MTTEQRDIEIVKAALRITRATSPYSELAWICDIRAAVCHLLPAEWVDGLLVRLWQDGVVEMRRADMVGGVARLVAESELRFETETWHYAGLAKEAE